MSVVTQAITAFPFKGRKLLVGCSGGSDSMVLLHALVAAGHRPVVLHVNYHLRGEASDLDQALVETVARNSKLECRVVHCPNELTAGKGVNLQAAARDFRRVLFREWIAGGEDHAVVLAHHGDDQVETFFLQYFRGSGSIGLGGMYEEKDNILRPFLGLFKEDIRNYAEQYDVSWREDASNQSVKYLRNRLRNVVLPALVAAVPGLKQGTLLLMEQFRQQRLLIEAQLEPLVSEWMEKKQLDVIAWNLLEEEQRILLLSLCGLPSWLRERIPELREDVTDQKLVTGDWIIVRKKNHLFAFPKSSSVSWEFKLEKIEFLPISFSKDELYLDGDAIEEADILIREPLPGDRIKSLGMNGSQLVSDVLKDAGVPVWERPFVPVITIKNEVVWIPGIKIGRRFIAGKTTQNKVRLSIVKRV